MDASNNATPSPNREAVAKLTLCVPALNVLLEQLVKFKAELKPLGRYMDRISNSKMTPSITPLQMMHQFLTSMRDASNAIMDFEQKQRLFPRDLPNETQKLYTEMVDLIHRAGKYDPNGINRNQNGEQISTENIWLGHPPESWQKSLKYILETWPFAKTGNSQELQGKYSVDAWIYIVGFFDLIGVIRKFKKIV